MEELNLIHLWKAQNEKIDQCLSLNRQLLKDVVLQKTASAITDLKRFKTRGIIAAIIYLIVLGSVLFFAITHYSPAANYFIVSFSIIFFINIKALADYIKHLAWADRIDFNGNITAIQQQLAAIQLSIFKHLRIMVLQFPFWTTFYLSSQWFPHDIGWAYIAFQMLMTGSFTWLAIWLFKHLTIENANNRWIKMFVEGSGSRSLYKALSFYQEIEDFKTEN